MERGLPEVLEEMVVTDGGLRCFLNHKAPLRDAEGEVIGLIGVARDVTELKNAEAALRRSELRYRTLVSGASAVTWSCPPSGLHVEPQPEWMAFTGQTAEEALSDGWTKVVHPADLPAAAAKWTEAVARGEPYVSEHRIRRHDSAGAG
jgi:PAS domain-containing protein